MNSDRKAHWEKVYSTSDSHEVSWTQDVPETSLELIKELNLVKSAKIIDVGGGDSKLVDHLLNEGFHNITVLDISSKALEKAQKRLGDRAEPVRWLLKDILDLDMDSHFDLWHDRATFHFLTNEEEIDKYINIVMKSVVGFLTIATFSDKGPDKCSGLDVMRYSEINLAQKLRNGFEKIRCKTEDHVTPFNSNQNFLFCSFKRKPG